MQRWWGDPNRLARASSECVWSDNRPNPIAISSTRSVNGGDLSHDQ